MPAVTAGLTVSPGVCSRNEFVPRTDPHHPGEHKVRPANADQARLKHLLVGLRLPLDCSSGASAKRK